MPHVARTEALPPPDLAAPGRPERCAGRAMSNRPHRRPRRSGQQRPDLVELAELTARLQGCTCHPDVEVTEDAPRLYRGDIAHDPDCRLLLSKAAPWN